LRRWLSFLLIALACLCLAPGSIVEWPPSLDMHGGKKDTRDMRGDYESQFSFSRGVRRDSEGYIVPSSLHLK